MKIKDDKKYWDKIEKCRENEASYYKQQMMYFKAKVEAYERMLVKAKLIIKFGDDK